MLGAATGLAVVVSALLAACGGSSGVKGHSEVRAEPVSKRIANPFMPAVGNDQGGVKPPPGTSSGTYNADLPGLYGGTRNYSQCDAAKMVTFLENNPDKASAWATTLGIQTSQISSYVHTLTAVTLRTETRVTNHGFVGGRANPIQSILEAGTAVFVNKYGEPVVKCYCGNPLTPPVLYTSPTYTGPLWSGFSTTNITIINQSTTVINTFTLVDPTNGKPFTRKAGTTGGSSDGPYTGSQPPQLGTPAPSPPPAQSNSSSSSSSTANAPENPSASFSPSSGKQGDTFVLSASGFNPGANLDVTLTRPDGVVEHYSISAGSDGSGSYTFTNTSSVVTGTYNATVSNPATGAQAQASVDVAPASGP